VEDARFAAGMQEMYLQDLANATEIVLDARHRVASAAARPRGRRRAGGSVARAAAGALRIGNTVGAAIADRRVLGPAEAILMAGVGLVLLALALLAVVWPLVVALPVVLVALWAGISLLLRARALHSGSGRSP
jgi:cardiolipin synthase